MIFRNAVFRSALVASAIGFAIATPASAGLVVTLNYDSSFATEFGVNAAAAQAAVAYAASIYDGLFSDPIHVNLTVAAAAGTGILGQSNTSISQVSYNSLRNALVTDAKSPDDSTAVGAGGSVVASDPVSGTHTWWVTKAQAKALGLTADDSTPDGTITFGAGWTYTFDPSNRAVSGAIDFIGVVEHEISEVMGRIGLSGGAVCEGPDCSPNVPNSYTLLDDFAYTGAGTKGLTFVGNDSFSINNGTTMLKQFNATAGGDSRDWASGSNDSFNAFSSGGVENNISAVDVRELDVLGYDLAAPEPGTVMLLGAGLALILRRRGCRAA